jgi:hypothetical protein
MELTDGVLVRDPSSKIPVVVKSDALQAVIDDALPTGTPTSTP